MRKVKLANAEFHVNYISHANMVNTNTPPPTGAEFEHTLMKLPGFSNFSTAVRVCQQQWSARVNYVSLANMNAPLLLTKLINNKDITLPTGTPKPLFYGRLF
jgi:hypothetical protein